MHSRVFLVQEPLRRDGPNVISRIDMSILETYGEPVFLCSWGELRNDGSGDMALDRVASLYHKIRGKLRTYSDADYLVCVGNPALIAMAAMIASECNNGRVRILDWIRDQECYRLIEIDANCQPSARDLARARSAR